jgi:hypothetical protein
MAEEYAALERLLAGTTGLRPQDEAPSETYPGAPIAAASAMRETCLHQHR